ncbi:MAG: phosphatase PAP2 family protein [Clostridia bacterium]|nr:phosphatase PAP2 family protein [Clostridia bacterium]
MKAKLKKAFAPVVEYYRDLRPHNLTSKKYNHLLLLLFWAVFGFMFLAVERLFPIWFPAHYHIDAYYSVVCAADAHIPFHEAFVIPYYYWFAFLALPAFYFGLWEPRAFRDFQWGIILTYTVAMIVYVIWPTKQDLRPEYFPRDNILTTIAKGLYDFDTNTNVCPSIHVLGSLAVMFAGLHSRTLRGWGWKLFFILSAVWISMSTVFLKQHSLVDVIAALGVGAVCYAVQFWLYPVLEKHWIARKERKASASEVEPVPAVETLAAAEILTELDPIDCPVQTDEKGD